MLLSVFNINVIRLMFHALLEKEEFVIDRTGVKMIEILNANFIADDDNIFGTPSSDWNERELEWYLSQSLNVNDITPPIPAIWKNVADADGMILSNYGWCVFSKENGNQFNSTFNALVKNPNTRQAIMIYNRPSMHDDWNKNGMTDFMCCLASHFFIRDNTLINIVYWRSQDAIYGFKGDVFWHKYVYQKLHEQLLYTYPTLKTHELQWNCSSLHIYERHFPLVRKQFEKE